MSRSHAYQLRLTWTGNRGTGTAGPRAYARDHRIEAAGKPVLEGSSDPAFLGDPGRYNPEELLVAATAACHMLWYLHLCADAGVTVLTYEDDPVGTMVETADGGGRFTRILLRPRVRLAAGADEARALALHTDAHRLCFIANSLNCPVVCEPEAVTPG
ncbi:MAG: OsmC family protein [Rhodospirillales bacterium]